MQFFIRGQSRRGIIFFCKPVQHQHGLPLYRAKQKYHGLCVRHDQHCRIHWHRLACVDIQRQRVWRLHHREQRDGKRNMQPVRRRIIQRGRRSDIVHSMRRRDLQRRGRNWLHDMPKGQLLPRGLLRADFVQYRRFGVCDRLCGRIRIKPVLCQCRFVYSKRSDRFAGRRH